MRSFIDPMARLLVLLACWQGVASLTTPFWVNGKGKELTLTNKEFNHPLVPITQCSTSLHASVLDPMTKASGVVSPSVRNAILLGAAVLALVKRQQILYPGTSPDSKYSEPLPPGSFGCPFFGHNIFKATSEGGPSEFFRQTSAKLGKARTFKYVFLGRPNVVVAGIKNVKQVFKNEFKRIHIVGPLPGTTRIFGQRNILMCTDNQEHSFMRRLVSTAMAQDAIDKATPSLQKAATEQIDKILQVPNSRMEDVCTDFTLDVAWRQILGLNLNTTEAALFHQAVHDWISGFLKLETLLLPGIQFTKQGRSYAYLVSHINKKIDELNLKGPDESALSAMLFAHDEFNGKKLTRQQVVDNSILLIFAGTETTASTLTTGILLLGLHPDIFHKMKEEQHSLATKDQGLLSLQQVNKECPYLDAVIKEIMRIKPIAGVVNLAS